MTNNKIIADFMGVDFSLPYMYGPGRFTDMKEEHLDYSGDWAWLMPVVEKISNLIIPKEFIDELEFDASIDFIMHPLGVSFDINGGTLMITDSGFLKPGGTWLNITVTRKIQTYTAVLNFIYWYNGKIESGE